MTPKSEKPSWQQTIEENQERKRGDVGAYILAILFPIVGVIIGIVWAAKSKVGPALAIWATSFLSWIVVWIYFLGLA